MTRMISLGHHQSKVFWKDRLGIVNITACNGWLRFLPSGSLGPDSGPPSEVVPNSYCA